MLLLAAALALLLFGDGGVVQAQSSRVLVSNRAFFDRDLAAHFDNYDLAQEFYTGSNEEGYTLTSVTLILHSPGVGTAPTVKIFSGSANGTEVATLSDLGGSKWGAPDGTTLARRTRYWVVAEGGNYEWHTTGIQETSTSAPGFNILHYRESRGKDTTGSFVKTQSRPLMITVEGTIIFTTNTAASGAPAITAPNVFRVPAALGVSFSGIIDPQGKTNIADSATYRWQRFDSAGATLETDSIGTASTYTLTEADVGKTLKVVVNFTDDYGISEGPLTSAATSAITAAATDCNAPPTLVGGATFLGGARKLGVGVDTWYGFDSFFSGTGSLDNVTFTTADANIYEIEQVLYVPNDNGLDVVVKNSNQEYSLSTSDANTLVLHVCDQGLYEFRNASRGTIDYFFIHTGQNWLTHAERTIYLSQDTAAPTLDSATVDRTSLALTFSEDLGAAASLANGAFTVKKTPRNAVQTTLTLDSGAPPSVSGSTVTLTLDSASRVKAADTNVLVSYTSPMSGTDNKLVDKFGNEAATFTDVAVTNTTVNIAAGGAPAITAPNVFRVPAALGVDLSGITDPEGTTNIADNATYKWQRFDATGSSLETDSIGTASTYTLTDADAGKTLKVVVNFTDDDNNSEGPLTSAATSAITAAASCNAPTLVGGATFLGAARKLGVGAQFYILDRGPTLYGFTNLAGITGNAGMLDSATFTTAASNTYEI